MGSSLGFVGIFATPVINMQLFHTLKNPTYLEVYYDDVFQRVNSF